MNLLSVLPIRYGDLMSEKATRRYTYLQHKVSIQQVQNAMQEDAPSFRYAKWSFIYGVH
jgi:hypothetical protein